MFENGQAVYINPSLCKEFSYLHYAIRLAKKNKQIHSYRVKHGVMYMRKGDGDEEVEISHESDLEKHGLPIPPRMH